MVKKIRFITFLLLLFAGLCPGETLSGRISRCLSMVNSQKVDYGIVVYSADASRIVYQKNGSAPLIPASNQKLLTTITALHQLGSDFNFHTTFGLLGDDLVVVGDGDPGFGDPVLSKSDNLTGVFDDWAEKLKARGITEVKGRIIFDDSIFDRELHHPSWPADQLNKWYTAPISGLTFNDNCVAISVKFNDQNQAQLIFVPPTESIRIIPKWKQNGASRTIINPSWKSPDSMLINITVGSKPAGPVFVPVKSPRIFFSGLCRERLEKNGIHIDGDTVFDRIRRFDGSLPTSLKIIAVHTTPLIDDIRRADKNSQNLFAESIFKRIGFNLARQRASFPVGSWTTGGFAVRDFLQHTLSASCDGINIDDGGGLSRKNRVTTGLLVKLLRFANGNYPDFIKCLSISGHDGTLRRRMRRTLAEGKIYGKTGYILGVSALSGYVVDSKGGVKYIFSMLFNNFNRGQLWQIKSVQDKICIELCREVKQNAPKK